MKELFTYWLGRAVLWRVIFSVCEQTCRDHGNKIHSPVKHEMWALEAKLYRSQRIKIHYSFSPPPTLLFSLFFLLSPTALNSTLSTLWLVLKAIGKTSKQKTFNSLKSKQQQKLYIKKKWEMRMHLEWYDTIQSIIQ